MKEEEFYRKYANTPLGKRYDIISFEKSGKMTINDVYVQMIKLGDQIRPLNIEQEELLKLADIFFKTYG